MINIYRSIGVAAVMILFALAAASGLISERAFEIGFLPLVAASVVVLGSGRRCRVVGN